MRLQAEKTLEKQCRNTPLFNHEGLRLHPRVEEKRHALTGVTRDIAGRLFEHQNELTPGFTSRYGVKTLVWFEEHDLLTTAITREKTIKKWPRQWKLNLIEEIIRNGRISPGI
ncbi:putative GIY-YIG superfamily endonuclease [Rhizobium sp. BK316]|nr:putative GIY-YIG superfamily endonuclease [Rhizobium sp. BK316]